MLTAGSTWNVRAATLVLGLSKAKLSIARPRRRRAMTLNAPSFFAGVGTVLGLLIVGFGGGVLMSGVVSDNTPREPNKIEKRAAEIAKPPAVETKPATAV